MVRLRARGAGVERFDPRWEGMENVGAWRSTVSGAGLTKVSRLSLAGVGLCQEA